MYKKNTVHWPNGHQHALSEHTGAFSMLPDGYRSNAPKTHSKIGEYLKVLVRRCVHLGFYHQRKSLFVLSIRSHEEFQVWKKRSD